MSSTNPGAVLPARERGSKSYVRFIVLTAARTGSYMLTSSLNSSPNIVCFGELFNPLGKHVDYRVDGYEMYAPRERKFQDEDIEGFLNERIFYERREQIGAVGFKAPQLHFWAYQDLEEWLVRERDIYVLYLRRRNLLRMLVSLRVAMQTWGWTDYQRHTPRSVLKPANALRALRHPLKAAGIAKDVLWPKKQAWKESRTKLALSVQECREFFAKDTLDTAHYDDLFGEHDIHTLYYEDLVAHYDATLEGVQTFLGLAPRPLAPMTRQQNPEPLRELIVNYDELYEAFKGTPEAAYFE